METQAAAPGGLRDELRGDAQTLTDAAKQRLHTEVDARKGGAVSQVKSVSSAIGSAASELGQDAPSWLRSGLEKASQTIQKVADSVEQKDSRQLSQDLQQVARSNPGTFLAISALAGFAAARVLQAGTTGSTRSQAQPYATDETFGSSEGSAMSVTVAPDPFVNQGAAL